MPAEKVILFEDSEEPLKSTEIISSVALCRTMSTSCNWDCRGSSNVRGRNIKPFGEGFMGNAPLCNKNKE
jgi:hypothetical protein